MVYYFNIKPTKDESLILNQVHSVIRRYWDECRKDKKELSKTFENKIIFDLVEGERALKFITRGWFKYGAIINGTNIDVKVKDDINDILQEKIIKLCKEYDCNKNMYDWQFAQYKKFDNKLYSSMLNLKISLESDRVSEKNIRIALSDFYSKLYDKKEYLEMNDLIEEYISIAEQLLISSEDINRDSKKVLEFFNSVWNCFANFNYAYTVEGVKKEEVKSKALKAYKYTFSNCKREILDYMSEEIIPSKRVLLEITTPLQKEVLSSLKSFK